MFGAKAMALAAIAAETIVRIADAPFADLRIELECAQCRRGGRLGHLYIGTRRSPRPGRPQVRAHRGRRAGAESAGAASARRPSGMHQSPSAGWADPLSTVRHS